MAEKRRDSLEDPIEASTLDGSIGFDDPWGSGEGSGRVNWTSKERGVTRSFDRVETFVDVCRKE